MQQYKKNLLSDLSWMSWDLGMYEAIRTHISVGRLMKFAIDERLIFLWQKL